MSDVYQEALVLHREKQGKLEIATRMKASTRDELALAYTPGVAEPCRVIAKDPAASFDLTWRGRTVAVISDGSAVLGLGNIGPEAALPVMEGKALLMKEFAGVDAVPIVVKTQDPVELIRFVEQIAPSFAGVNLEDIAAPACFQVEEALQDIGIPVFHDDQHGTAIVVTAALMNAARVVGKSYESLQVVVVGAGAAGLAVARMLLGLDCSKGTCMTVPGAHSVGDVIVVDTKGALVAGRADMNIYKQALAGLSNKQRRSGGLADVFHGADVVVGVSGPGSLTADMVRSMAPRAVVLAMANPVPEIFPDEALAAGAAVVATGRSDYPNQINNVLAFPGVFLAVTQGRLTQITPAMKLAAAQTIAALIPEPSATQIVPPPFMPGLAQHVADAILQAAGVTHSLV